jgi:PHD/YefM family antitoxin component YafN of YafNO toxin-antitoxin module
MSLSVLPPDHVDEPQAAPEYAEVLSRVAAERKPIIVRRSGEDLAAVVPLDYLEVLQDMLAQQEAQQLLAQLDWERLLKTSRPPQSWFEGDEPQPF